MRIFFKSVTFSECKHCGGKVATIVVEATYCGDSWNSSDEETYHECENCGEQDADGKNLT